MRKSHAIGLVLVSVVLSHALAPAIAWAQFKVQAALDITPSTVAASGSAPQFSCSKTDATCTLQSATADATTSATAPALALKCGANITDADLCLSVRDSADTNLFTVRENGRVVINTGSVPALDFAGSIGTIYGANDSAAIVLDGTTGAQLAWGGIGTVTCAGDGCTIGGTGYPRLNKSGAGAPTGTDCDAAGEVGRVYIDTSNNRWYFCNGAAWQYTDEDVP